MATRLLKFKRKRRDGSIKGGLRWPLAECGVSGGRKRRDGSIKGPHLVTVMPGGARSGEGGRRTAKLWHRNGRLERKHTKRVVGLSCNRGLPEADDKSLEEIMGGRLAEMREAGMPEDTAS